jgi:hypothetical protein
MLAVCIVALRVVVGQGRGLVRVDVHAGLYALAASVLLLHLATSHLGTRLQHGVEAHRTAGPALRPADDCAVGG